MKILVTGANGYLGVGIVKELLEKGCQVIAADRCTNEVDARAKCVDCDLFEVTEPYEFFGMPDAVLHLAWRDGFKHQSRNHLLDLPGHYIFLEKLIRSGIAKVAVMGSMHEVGFHEGEIDEYTSTNPLSLYGISKDALRRSMELLQKETPFVLQWIRGFYIVANTEKGCSIFSKIVQAEKAGKTEFPFTKGTNKYDFISYEKFCQQVAAVLCQDEVKGIINCCSGYAVPLKDEVESFLKQYNYEIKLNYGAFPDREYDSREVWGNRDKIDRIMSAQRNYDRKCKGAVK